MAWCLRDEFGNVGPPLKTFDVSVDGNGVMEPQMADGEVVNPTPMDESIEMDIKPDPGILHEDPPLEEKVNAPEAMEQDKGEDGGSGESSLEDDRG